MAGFEVTTEARQQGLQEGRQAYQVTNPAAVRAES
jgi:hypothetical protein